MNPAPLPSTQGMPPAPSSDAATIGLQNFGAPDAAHAASTAGPSTLAAPAPTTVEGPAFAERLAPSVKSDPATQTESSFLSDPFIEMDRMLENVTSAAREFASGKEMTGTDRFKLLEMQMRMHSVALRADLVGKLVEHGTGSVKQISNTQT